MRFRYFGRLACSFVAVMLIVAGIDPFLDAPFPPFVLHLFELIGWGIAAMIAVRWADLAAAEERRRHD